MNKSKNVIGILSILLILSLATTAVTFALGDGGSSKVKGTITKVSSPDQNKVLVPKWAESPTFVLENLGTNIAKGKPVTANGYEDVYEAAYATDGKADTYWEGKANSYPNILTVDLQAPAKVGKIRLRLNPDKIWGKRVQGFSILGSSDGKDFKELVPSTNYQYDPKTGNLVTITLPTPTETRFIRLQFTENTGANGGQVAEFEVYPAN